MASKLSGKDKTFSLVLFTILKAAVIGMGLSAALLLLFSFLLSKKDIPFEVLPLFTSLLIIISSFLAGYIAAKKLKQRGMAVGAGCGALIFLVIALFSLMKSSSVGTLALIKLALSVISGSIGGVLGVNSKKKLK